MANEDRILIGCNRSIQLAEAIRLGRSIGPRGPNWTPEELVQVAGAILAAVVRLDLSDDELLLSDFDRDFESTESLFVYSDEVCRTGGMHLNMLEQAFRPGVLCAVNWNGEWVRMKYNRDGHHEVLGPLLDHDRQNALARD